MENNPLLDLIEKRENMEFIPEAMINAVTFKLEGNKLSGYDEQGRTVFMEDPEGCRIKTYGYEEGYTKDEWYDNRKILENASAPAKKFDPQPVISVHKGITKLMKRFINVQKSKLMTNFNVRSAGQSR